MGLKGPTRGPSLTACLHGGGGPQIGEVTRGRSPDLSCKRDQIKMRDYMDRRVTSPTWGPHLHVDGPLVSVNPKTVVH